MTLRSARFFTSMTLLLVLSAGCASRSVKKFKLPTAPTTHLPDIQGEFWRDFSNWPNSITNCGLRYNLTIRLNDGRDDQEEVESFETAAASGKKVEAYYYVDVRQLRDFSMRRQKKTAKIYGPKLTQFPNTKSFVLTMHYDRLISAKHYYDSDGKIWSSSFTRIPRHQLIDVLYSDAGEVIGFYRIAPSRWFPLKFTSQWALNGQRVEKEEYDRAFWQFKRERVQKID
jgi:hypothetical protein